MAFRYPVALELAGRPCVVLGGDAAAEQRACALLDAGARVTAIAPSFVEGLERLDGQGRLRLVRRAYVPGDLEGVFLAVAVTSDPQVRARAFVEAEDRHVLFNSMDDVEHCHFAVPAIVRRGDLTLAISTGGKAPALAKRLRRRLSDELGEELGPLVELLGEVREEALRTRRVDFETWAARWQSALDEDLVGLIGAGRHDEARAVVRAVLDGLDRLDEEAGLDEGAGGELG